MVSFDGVCGLFEEALIQPNDSSDILFYILKI